MENYKVLAEGWLEDGKGIGAYRMIGDAVQFNATQAFYITQAGIVKLDAPKVAPAEQAAKAK